MYKKENIMVTRSDLVKKCALIGGGAAIGMYAIFGFLQGAAIGGAAGVGLVNYLFGSSTMALMANEILPRIMIAASMLAGVVVSCVMFVVAGSMAGAAGGLVVSMFVQTEEGGYTLDDAVPEED